MTYPTDGILLIDKSEGESSYDVIRKLKRIFSTLDIRKIGHAGTLDPFATGLLIILIGQGTKLSPFIMPGRKRYLATLHLGIETETLDPTGLVVRKNAVANFSPESIINIFSLFTGEIEQTPPIYSAVKYKGTRSYKLARKGQKVSLKKRTVTIYSIKVITVDLPDVTIEVECSGGTYIRSLAADFGRALGPGAHLSSLRRLACGSFEIKHALNSNEISSESNLLLLQDKLIPLNGALPDMKEITVESSIVENIRHGRQSVLDNLVDHLEPSTGDGTFYKLIGNGELVAVVKLQKDRRNDHVKLEISRVFS